MAALLGGILASYAAPMQCVVLASGALVVTLWIARRYLGLSLRLTVAITLVAAALIGGEWLTGALARLEVPGWLPGKPLFATWTPYRHIDVMEHGDSLTVYADGIAFQF